MRGNPLTWAAAVCAVLPLLAPEVWSGFRLATSDPVLSVIAATEQPLSVRTPGGQWAIGLALAWFALAAWHRDVRLWEGVLIVLGTIAAMVRVGNLWLDALALVPPLARQISLVRPKPWLLAAAAALSLGVAGYTLYTTRPPDLPSQAVRAAQSTSGSANVFADWRWAATLQRELPTRHVLAAGGLTSEPPDFWLDYVRVVQDFEQWPTELQQRDVDMVVLDTTQPALADQLRASADWHVDYDTGRVLVAERVH